MRNSGSNEIEKTDSRGKTGKPPGSASGIPAIQTSLQIKTILGFSRS